MGYNKINLYGNQICDYLYIQKDAVDNEKFENIDSEPTEWTDTTLLQSQFNDERLVAGNTDMIGKLNGYQIRRKEGASSNTKYIDIKEEL